MRKLIFLFIAFLTLSTDIVEYPYYQKFDPQAKQRAIYIYNFAKNFEWTNTEGTFVIAVVGESPGLVAELTNLAKIRMVGSQKIEIQNHSSLNEFSKAHIVFITPDKSHFLADAVVKYKGKGTLIVTEKAGLAKIGATINFIIEDNQPKFELNKSAAARAGLNVSSSLEKLAKTVYN
jgi:hypothetical protein